MERTGKSRRRGSPSEGRQRRVRRWRASAAAIASACCLLAATWSPADAITGVSDAAASSNAACDGNALTDYGFTDVADDHGHVDAINCLAHYGISVGTGDGTAFSPNDDAPRWQMALFMLRAARVAGVDLPPAADQGFTDIGDRGQTIQDAVNQLVAAGMSNGHTATLFKPDDTVTREQMALFVLHFLAKASDRVTVGGDGSITIRDADGTDITADDSFTDVGQLSYAAQQAIIALSELAVTRGTAPGVFSPAAPVKRSQMASFITRALAFTSARPKATAPRAPTTTTTTTTTTAPPRSELAKITVPSSEPSGPCAFAIPAGVYNWERCAWRDYITNRDHNHVVSNSKAEALALTIWDEVVAPGKPDSPPTMEIVPSGTLCASEDTIGCYIPVRHHIRRFDSFKYVLLHELAHALIADSPQVQDCKGAINENTCAHGDLFRCVANHLYIEYAQIPDAGVCGTASQPDTATYITWIGETKSETDPLTLDTTEWHWAVLEVLEHNRGYPYQDSPATLQIRCKSSKNNRFSSELDIFLHFKDSFLAGRYDASVGHKVIPVAHRFGSRTGVISQSWLESTKNEAAFLPSDLRSAFIDNLLASEGEEIVIRVWQFDGNEFGTFEFASLGVVHHLEPVLESCDWRG